MRVAQITASGDWKFGSGKAQYVANSAAIRQNVVTRLRSFTNDWFADVKHGLDWFNLLGSRGNEKKILAAIEKTVLETPGVSTIITLRLDQIDLNRKASITLEFTTLFGALVSLQEPFEL